MKFNQEFVDEVIKRFPSVIVRESSFVYESCIHGYHFVFDNGFTASVQFHPLHYTSNRSRENETRYDEKVVIDPPLAETALTAEIAGWFNNGPLIEFEGWGDTVNGYQTPEQVLEWIEQHARKAV